MVKKKIPAAHLHHSQVHYQLKAHFLHSESTENDTVVETSGLLTKQQIISTKAEASGIKSKYKP